MKRFWSDVTVVAETSGFAVQLDGKPLRTPGKLALIVPSGQLAEAIAEEWRSVTDDVSPRAMALTGLANAAIERIAPDPAAFASSLAAYAESDLLCYRADAPEALVQRQAEAWDPLLDWARTRYDIHFAIVSGIIHQPQPAATVSRLTTALGACSAWDLAALSPIVSITGSLVAALALLEHAADPETVWRAGQVDEDWQAEQWGEDALAVATRAAHRREFDAAARFLTALG